jgi:argininosuccinate lyase
MDAVSDRDFVVEFLSCASLIQMHLSRLSEEIILWSTAEFAFIELDDSLSTGSSIMPQKKNADFAELIRGKTGRVYGSLLGILTTLKGLPLTYNKDMQEDKEGLFDVFDTISGSLRIMADMIRTLVVRKQRMRAQTESGFINATDAADYLAKKGVPFREAHEVVGKLVRYCITHSKSLAELSVAEFQGFSPFFSEDIFDAINMENVVNRRTSHGGTSDLSVRKQADLLGDLVRETNASLQHMRAVVALG